MPELRDPEKQIKHLQAAVNGKRRWCLFSPTLRGHTKLVMLSFQLLADGCPGDGFRYGVLHWVNTDNASEMNTSFFTVPKKSLTRKHLTAALRQIGIETAPGPEQDLLVMGGDEEQLERTMKLVEQIRAGRVQIFTPEAN